MNMQSETFTSPEGAQVPFGGHSPQPGVEVYTPQGCLSAAGSFNPVGGKSGLAGRILLMVLCLTLLGCGQFNVGSLLPNSFSRVSGPVVHVYPLGDIGWQKRVGVLPFQVPVNLGVDQGLGVAALFKDVFLGQRVFRTVEQLNLPYGSLAEAVELGRGSGVDYVLAGRVNTLLEGSEFGGARVEVSVRLLSTETGDTLWYLEQTLEQEMGYPDMGLMHRLAAVGGLQPVRKSNGTSPVAGMLGRVALNMAGVIAGTTTVQ